MEAEVPRCEWSCIDFPLDLVLKDIKLATCAQFDISTYRESCQDFSKASQFGGGLCLLDNRWHVRASDFA